MRRFGSFPLAMVLVAATLGAAEPKPSPGPVLPFIEDDYDRALTQARATRVPIFAEAWAPW
jgi:hypothetical protein